MTGLHGPADAGRSGFQAGVTMILGLILASSFGLTKDWKGLKQYDHEYAWVGPRGIFATERAIALLPLGACAGAGIVATVIASRFPAMAACVEIPGTVHELLALPLAILVSFRFERAYDRWWTSRQEVESLCSDIVGLAMVAKVNMRAVKSSATPEEKEMAIDCHRRLFSLLEALCLLIRVRLDNPGGGCMVTGIQQTRISSAPDALRAEDRLACTDAPDPVLWCLNAIMHCIHEGQASELYHAEVAAQMYAQVVSCQAKLRNCWMVIWQSSPAPFVIHMRTFMLCWCFTFPFTLVRSVQPGLIVPMTMVLSFAVLGIEFCSREMEHPFGHDLNDIPIQLLMSQLEGTVRELDRLQTYRPGSQPAAGPP